MMFMNNKKLFEKIKEYHFQFKHVTVLFIILFAFQLIVSFINKAAVKSFLSTTQEWYQKDSAEEIANLTTTSLELVLESIDTKAVISREEENKVIQAFNIIFSQQQLKHNIQGLYILVRFGDEVYAIDDGRALYTFLLDHSKVEEPTDSKKKAVVEMYKKIESELSSNSKNDSKYN